MLIRTPSKAFTCSRPRSLGGRASDSENRVRFPPRPRVTFSPFYHNNITLFVPAYEQMLPFASFFIYLQNFIHISTTFNAERAKVGWFKVRPLFFIISVGNIEHNANHTESRCNRMCRYIIYNE